MQARIPAALSALHNFISFHNPRDQPISSATGTSDTVQMYDDDDDILAGAPGPDDVDLRRDMIAQKMWDDYMLVCEERGIDRDAVIESDFDSEELEDNSEDDEEQ